MMTRPPTTYLFDDSVADGFAPFALTRPIGEVLYGRWSARERLERAFGRPVDGHISRPWLEHYTETGAPEVVHIGEIASDVNRVFWSSRAIADPGGAPSGRCNLWVDGALAGVSLVADEEGPDAAWVAEPAPLPDARDVEIEGEWLSAPWDLVSGGPERLRSDLEQAWAGHRDTDVPGAYRIGDSPLVLGEDVSIEPGVLIDTRSGPVEFGAGVEVRMGTRVQGPVYLGAGSRLLGGSVSVLSAGARSNLRGELEEVIILGYCNKSHDGFIGHAVLGRWVNLGAMTTNSDLKNNYSSVRMGPPDAAVDTGLTKLGCLMGDHVKTGIGALLNTGTIVGAGSNIFGSDLPPKWIPPFSWGQGVELGEYRRAAFLETATTVLGRRGVAADPATLKWLGAAWDEARG